MANLDLYRSTATRLFMGAAAGEPDGIPIIDDNTDNDYLFPHGFRTGHDPTQYVPDMLAAPLGMKCYADSDWDGVYDEQERAKSSLEHIYLRDWQGECLDQNGNGYCWAYSTGSAIMLRRLASHLPFVRLNPHSTASIIKGGRDQGGWCGLSLAHVRDHGMAEEGTGPGQWPVHSRQNSRFNDSAVKESMAKYRVTDDWYDLGKPMYGQELTLAQHFTVLANNCPAPSDFNWWGHSVCALRYVRIEADSWGLLILNSWKGWGRRGLSVLRGSKSRTDGSVSVVAALAG